MTSSVSPTTPDPMSTQTPMVTPQTPLQSSIQSPSQLSDEDILNEVITEVFGTNKFSTIKAILDTNDIDNLTDLAMFDYTELLELEGSVTTALGDVEDVSLTKPQAKKIAMLKNWYMSQPNPSKWTWLSLYKDDFATFIMNYSGSQYSTPTTPSPSTPSNLGYTVVTPTSVPPIDSALIEFNKGIKRSASDYPKLKEDKFFMSWDRTVQALATAQDVAEVLDNTYMPANVQEQALFKAKNSFMYSVFVSILDTAKSRKHVRRFQKDMDAQALYASLKTEYETGTANDIAVEAVRNEIMTMRLDDR